MKADIEKGQALDVIHDFRRLLKTERKAQVAFWTKSATAWLRQLEQPLAHPSAVPFELLMPRRSGQRPVMAAPTTQIVRVPPYLGATEDEERSIPNVVTRKEHGDAETGYAETWAVTFIGDPTADRLGSFYVQAAAVWLFEEVRVPAGCTRLLVTVPVTLEGSFLRWAGNIIDPQPVPANPVGMSLFARIDAWSPEWTGAVRGPGKTLANQRLDKTSLSESINASADLGLELNELWPYQQIAIGVSVTALVLAGPPSEGVEPNVTGLAAGGWRVPSVTFQFC